MVKYVIKLPGFSEVSDFLALHSAHTFGMCEGVQKGF